MFYQSLNNRQLYSTYIFSIIHKHKFIIILIFLEEFLRLLFVFFLFSFIQLTLNYNTFKVRETKVMKYIVLIWVFAPVLK